MLPEVKKLSYKFSIHYQFDYSKVKAQMTITKIQQNLPLIMSVHFNLNCIGLLRLHFRFFHCNLIKRNVQPSNFHLRSEKCPLLKSFTDYTNFYK